jgi:hypothetical protein
MSILVPEVFAQVFDDLVDLILKVQLAKLPYKLST